MAGTEAKSLAIGIDLGTANTRVAVFRNGAVEMIPDADGRLSMPSCVAFNDVGRLIGAPARSQHALNPAHTVYNVKRLLGLRASDVGLQTFDKHVSFAIGESAGQPIVKVEYMGERKWLTPVELLSMILVRAKENAEAYLGSPVHNAVVSIPATFSTECRGAIIDAAAVAGLNVWHTMPGPVAVAAFYAGSCREEELNVVIFDLGAGSCNVALVLIEEGIVIEAKSMASDNDLGGEDFISRLVTVKAKEFETKWKKNIWDNRRAILRLRKACEAAIRDLSSAYEAQIDVDSLYEGIDFHSAVSRLDFEDACRDLFKSTLDVIKRALGDAKMKKADVHRIVVVGGSSRIPRIQELLVDYFDGREMTRSVNPDEAEVSGLASEAAILSQDRSVPDRLTVEVLPMSIGVDGGNGMMQRIFRRNASAFGRKSEIVTLQKPVKFLHIYEGERARTRDCKKLASISLEKLELNEYFRRLSEFGTPEVDLECTIDISRCQFRGYCTVKEMIRKKTVTAALDLLGRLSKDDIERMKDDAERYKKVDDEERRRTLARLNLDSRIGLLSESLYNLPPSPFSQTLQRSIEDIRTLVDGSEVTDISEYYQPTQDLNAIELSLIRARRELPDRDTSLAGLRRTHLLLSSSTIIPGRESDLNDFRSIIDWLRMSVQTEASNYSKELERLVDLWEKLDIAVDGPPANEDDATGTEPTSTSDQQGKDTESNSQNVTQETSADELIMSASTNPTPRRPRAHRAPDSETLESLFSRPFEVSREPFTDSQFERISTFLRNDGNAAWSSVPRLYTVLRFIDQLDAMESFVANGITDIWFPFTNSTLPSALQPSAQFSFLDVQRVVLSKGFKFEKDTDRKHALFAQDEPLPFQVVGRLGRGAHGSVDKVMSIISHREYARKMFKKSRGLKRQDIKTFITELSILKRVDHRHCVELLGSYSDPKHFALIMEPVGDHNLAEYYHKAKDSSDKISLMRGFFGCLANAMRYLHASNIRHRDIKPQNIIVKGERVLITDFGIAYNWENLTRGTTTADSGKTLVYASPEVVRVEARNESADVWSLGCVFLEMATVIKGETIGNMRHVFHERTDSYAFYANGEGITAWMDRLRGVAPKTDNVMLDWAASMLQHKASQRPTAGTLFDAIATECARCGILFCGPCCMDDEGSSVTDGEDDSHLWGEDTHE